MDTGVSHKPRRHHAKLQTLAILSIIPPLQMKILEDVRWVAQGGNSENALSHWESYPMKRPLKFILKGSYMHPTGLG